ncbi:MAG: hypothetical protein WC091_02800 [Sulfuricellaceae bacterium]
MNKTMFALLLFPLFAFADALSGAAPEFVGAASAIAAPDWVRVSHRKAASGVDDMGLLAPSRQFFTPTGDLTEKGRVLLEKAEVFARQTNKKLNVLIPEESLNGVSVIYAPIGKVQRNAFIGNHVYISTED